jgi:alkyl sulfatase BDS1-like metallo-beta-lactamase superfamily hydrolase
MAANPRDAFTAMVGKSPEEAKLFWTGGPVEVAERTWFASLLSGVTVFETDAGLVVVDAGLEAVGPALAGLIRSKTRAPVHTAIYTHGHVDHAYGLAAFLVPGQAPPRVVAHRNVPARFARYARTARHNRALNARQFGGAAHAHEGAGRTYDIFKAPLLPPTDLYDDALELEIGGVHFALRHAKGETDDATWVSCAERGVLCSGDLFIWAVPNAGNPQKVQRYPWAWAEALRAMAEVGARTLCPGHGAPVVGDAPRVRAMLTDTAAYLEAIVERTLAAMERGVAAHVDIVREVELPQSDAPYLQPIYDDPEFVVRNVVRYFGGWYSGRPSELKPAARRAVATEIASLAGGAARLAARATELAEQGEMALACHLADYALEAEPATAAVRDAVAAVYERRAAREPSLMAVNLFRAASEDARAGRLGPMESR